MSYSKIMLNSIIEEKQIKTVFQPIVSLRDGSVFGYEVLSRITDPSVELNIEDLFFLSEKLNRIWDLELLCRTTALETAFKKFKSTFDKKLFLNVNPNIMYDKKFRQGFTKEYLKQFGITPEQIIIEITEKNVIKDMRGFMSTIKHYKEQNYKIAIDDAGAGYSGLNLISDVKPHIIKIDMKLVRDIHLNSMKYALVKSMIELSNISNIYLVAEGIENIEELNTLISIGVQYGQGFYLQKPSETIQEIPQKVLNEIRQSNSQKNHLTGRQASNIYIENLASNAISVAPNVTVEHVYNFLSKNKQYQGVCVVKNDEVIGVVMKNKLIVQLSGRYGFSLYQNRMISTLMDKDFLCVDYQTPISTVSHIATLRNQNNIYDFVVITKENKLLGTVSVKDLLQKITDIELINAKYQNPLSELPGNIEIEQKLTESMDCNNSYSVLYVDIDNFKAYNDVYGFKKGDLIIKCLADFLKENVSDNQFVGHIGGDDFIIIGKFNDIKNFCNNIVFDFEEIVKQYYNEKDLENGYIITKNRSGITEQFPLITISIAGVKNAAANFTTITSMSESLSKIKKQIKQNGGNQYILFEENIKEECFA